MPDAGRKIKSSRLVKGINYHTSFFSMIIAPPTVKSTR